MLIGILIGGVVAIIFGVPLLWVLVVGAILQGILAYVTTKNRLIITNLIGLGMVIVAAYVLIPIITQDTEGLKPLADTVDSISPWLIGISSVLLILHATYVGVFDIKETSESK